MAHRDGSRRTIKQLTLPTPVIANPSVTHTHTKAISKTHNTSLKQTLQHANLQRLGIIFYLSLRRLGHASHLFYKPRV